MTNADVIRGMIGSVADILTDTTLANILLDIARSPINDDGDLYNRWCDNQGACKGKVFENIEDVCSEDDHIACILRFLQRECK